MLQTLEITNFRGIRSLKLENLQPVNLVVGKNNSGKTSLLEAIAVLVDPSTAMNQFRELRTMEQGLNQQFQIGAYSSWVINITAENDTAILTGSWDAMELKVVLLRHAQNPEVAVIDSPQNRSRPGRGIGSVVPAVSEKAITKSCVIGTVEKSPQSLVQSFSNAVLRRNGEESIESQLRAVDKRISKVRVHPTSKGNIIVVDIGLNRLVPLSQVGQGIQRLVAIFSEIIGAEAEICFIDEIENGIHHSHLEELWTGLAAAAKEFGVQVFATTHSYECIEAAHRAFSARPSYDFSVIQLFRETNEIQGRVLDQPHIAAGIAGDIELRG